jgi:hypothetical protein
MTDEFMTRDRCDKKHDELLGALKELNDRLYKDNGRLSIQTRLGRLENYYRVQLWVLAIIVAVWVGEVVPKLWRAFAGIAGS